MTHFQAPGNRKLDSAESKLHPWPANPDGYRLFVTANSGDERIGIETGQRIELQLTDGKDYRIQTTEEGMIESVMNVSVDVGFSLADSLPRPARISNPVASSDPQIFTIAARTTGKTILTASNPHRFDTASLQVVVGHFENHPGMQVDLIAAVCRGSDSLKIHALQRMLHNQYLGGGDVYSNGDNIFAQQAPTNKSSDSGIGTMTCGIVARFRAEEIFDKVLAPTFQWYHVGAIHEPLSSRVTDRRQVKYRSQRVETLRGQILRALNDGQAVRVGVLDNPLGMTPESGDLVAYYPGGHTVLIVGHTDDGTQFLYIDPWSGGSMMEYQGGIVGNKFLPGKCCQIGKLIVTHDPDRRVNRSDIGRNIIRQHPDTYGAFSLANNPPNYLEVVSAPFVVPGRA
jgi:hypothetical protein